MRKDDATWLRICYAVFGVIVAYTTLKATETLGIQTGWAERYFQWYSLVAAAFSIGVGVVTLWVVSQEKQRHEYFLASIGELRKVSWPTIIDTRRMTIIVCVVVGVFAVILAVFDLFWSQILKIFLA